MLTKFVGGPYAGRIMDVMDSAQVVRVPVYNRNFDFQRAEVGYEAGSFETVDYRRQVIWGSTRRITVMIPTNWDADRLLEELIDSYEPHA